MIWRWTGVDAKAFICHKEVCVADMAIETFSSNRIQFSECTGSFLKVLLKAKKDPLARTHFLIFSVTVSRRDPHAFGSGESADTSTHVAQLFHLSLYIQFVF